MAGYRPIEQQDGNDIHRLFNYTPFYWERGALVRSVMGSYLLLFLNLVFLFLATAVAIPVALSTSLIGAALFAAPFLLVTLPMLVMFIYLTTNSAPLLPGDYAAFRVAKWNRLSDEHRELLRPIAREVGRHDRDDPEVKEWQKLIDGYDKLYALKNKNQATRRNTKLDNLIQRATEQLEFDQTEAEILADLLKPTL